MKTKVEKVEMHPDVKAALVKLGVYRKVVKSIRQRTEELKAEGRTAEQLERRARARKEYKCPSTFLIIAFPWGRVNEHGDFKYWNNVYQKLCKL